MRFLCLHGVGSSGSICASQFAPFLKAVDPSYEFVFVDGPRLSERGPGVAPYLEGPFFSHTAGYAPEEMKEAQEHFADIIEELGPFDGVLGFSQGAALALSYIYEQQVSEKPAPFKFGLFFSSVMPSSSDTEYCRDLLERLCGRRRDLASIRSTDESITRDERLYIDTMLRVVVPAQKHGALLPNYDMKVYTEGDGSAAPRAMLSPLLKEKIRIPTVHVSGKKDFDFMRSMSEIGRGMCEERLMRVLEHSGAHHPPQKVSEVKAVVRAMEWAIGQSERMAHL